MSDAVQKQFRKSAFQFSSGDHCGNGSPQPCKRRKTRLNSPQTIPIEACFNCNANVSNNFIIFDRHFRIQSIKFDYTSHLWTLHSHVLTIKIDYCQRFRVLCFSLTLIVEKLMFRKRKRRNGKYRKTVLHYILVFNYKFGFYWKFRTAALADFNKEIALIWTATKQHCPKAIFNFVQRNRIESSSSWSDAHSYSTANFGVFAHNWARIGLSIIVTLLSLNNCDAASALLLLSNLTYAQPFAIVTTLPSNATNKSESASWTCSSGSFADKPEIDK